MVEEWLYATKIECHIELLGHSLSTSDNPRSHAFCSFVGEIHRQGSVLEVFHGGEDTPAQKCTVDEVLEPEVASEIACVGAHLEAARPA